MKTRAVRVYQTRKKMRKRIPKDQVIEKRQKIYMSPAGHEQSGNHDEFNGNELFRKAI